MKKFLAIILALVLVLSIGSVALAAEEQTAEDIMKAVAVAEADVINIELKNDISDGLILEVPEGKTVTVSGNYTLGMVGLLGGGRFDLKVKEITEGLWIYDAATVSVEAQAVRSDSVVGVYDEEADAWISSSEYPAVYIACNATVSIKADIIGGSGSLPADGMKDDDSYANGNDGLVIMNANSEVTVVGNITGGNAAGTIGRGGGGLFVYGGDVAVTVTGNVTGGSVNADATVDGLDSNGGSGIVIFDGKHSVTVNGNVTGGSTTGYNGTGGAGIDVYSNVNAKISVTGDVTGGNATGAGDAIAGSGAAVPIFGTDWEASCEVNVGGTIAAGRGKNNAAIFYYPYTGYAYLDTYVIDYEEWRGENIPDLAIMNYVTSAIGDMYTGGFLTVEDLEPYYTAIAKLMAAELNYTLPADYKATVDVSTGFANRDEHITAMTEGLTEQEKDEANVAIAPEAVEAYNAMIRGVFADSERHVKMPSITAWQILPGDSGRIYTTYWSPDYASAMETLELFSVDTIAYTVKVADAQGGTVTADKTEVKAGETVTLKSTADAGYTLGEWKVYGKAIEGNTFEAKVGGGILVEASYTATQGNPPTGDGGVWFALLAVTALAGAAVLIRHREKA